MENNINIAEILKDCPEGMKLYSPLFGEVTLGKSGSDNISIFSKNDDGDIIFNTFAENGLFYSGYSQSQCLLFPSSEMRDWTKFFKRGDVVWCEDDMYAIFEGWANDDYTKFNTTIDFYEFGASFDKEMVCDTDLFVKASDEERAVFIANAERTLKGKYNPETLKVEPVKPTCPFKPFDKVLVRNYDTDEWLPGFFYRLDKDWNYPYHIMNLHHLTDYAYLYCIPYEGNEHLLGTTDPYTEGGSK